MPCCLPCRKAGGLQILCCQGIAVNDYSFTLEALALKPSDFCNIKVKMEKDIEQAVMAIPAGEEEHEKVLLAIDKFEEGIRVKPKGDEEPYYCVKYCRECELVCPVGK